MELEMVNVNLNSEDVFEIDRIVMRSSRSKWIRDAIALRLYLENMEPDLIGHSLVKIEERENNE